MACAFLDLAFALWSETKLKHLRGVAYSRTSFYSIACHSEIHRTAPLRTPKYRMEKRLADAFDSLQSCCSKVFLLDDQEYCEVASLQLGICKVGLTILLLEDAIACS